MHYRNIMCEMYNNVYITEFFCIAFFIAIISIDKIRKKEGALMEFQYHDMGIRIKIRRKELKIKQAELAEALGISNNHMSSIENEKQKPSLDTFIGICKCLRVSSDYLLLGVMHAQNVPLDIIDKLRLCSPSDVELAKEFIELLVKRSSENHIKNNYILP